MTFNSIDDFRILHPVNLFDTYNTKTVATITTWTSSLVFLLDINSHVCRNMKHAPTPLSKSEAKPTCRILAVNQIGPNPQLNPLVQAVFEEFLEWVHDSFRQRYIHE
jgi:hypothetical protein